jgi:hypothetical protein
VRLVLLALLGGAAAGVEIGEGGEALHALLREVAVGHGMAQHGGADAALAQAPREPARDLRLAAARAHRRHRDHRQRCRQHRALRSEQGEVRAAG